jgi:hypothetical protein
VREYFYALPEKKQSDVLLVGRFIMRHLMALRSNRFSISETVLLQPHLLGPGDHQEEPTTGASEDHAQRDSEQEDYQPEPVTQYVTVGHAVCAAMNMFNHSCCSNAVWDYVDDDAAASGCGHHRFVLRSVRPIKAGEEVTISYGYNFQTDDREHRQSMLK